MFNFDDLIKQTLQFITSTHVIHVVLIQYLTFPLKLFISLEETLIAKAKVSSFAIFTALRVLGYYSLIYLTIFEAFKAELLLYCSDHRWIIVFM